MEEDEDRTETRTELRTETRTGSRMETRMETRTETRTEARTEMRTRTSRQGHGDGINKLLRTDLWWAVALVIYTNFPPRAKNDMSKH